MMKTNRRFTYCAAAFCGLALSACGPEEQKRPDIKPLKDLAQPIIDAKTADYFMMYLMNGERVHLDKAVIKTPKSDVRYSIYGDNNTQGDITSVLIQHNDGPPRVGTFSTNEGNITFSLRVLNAKTNLWETRGTLDLANMSFGTGTLTYTEVTETYAVGTFSFLANSGGEDEIESQYNVTEGNFKARIWAF